MLKRCASGASLVGESLALIAGLGGEKDRLIGAPPVTERNEPEIAKVDHLPVGASGFETHYVPLGDASSEIVKIKIALFR